MERVILAAYSEFPLIDRQKIMSEHTYKVIEIVGSSQTGNDDAIKNAIAEASRTLKHIGWFEVVKQTGHVEDGRIHHFQTTLKIGFRLDQQISG
jgi:flavin-binding protein dodecin